MSLKWDDYVDKNFSFMNEAGFNIKFWSDKSDQIFKIAMQFIDLMAIDFDQK